MNPATLSAEAVAHRVRHGGPTHVARILDFWRAATRVVGHASLTAREARRLWNDHGAGPLPPNFATALTGMVRNGSLRVANCPGLEKRYMLPDGDLSLPLRPTEPRDIALELLLRAHEAGTPVRVPDLIRALSEQERGARLDNTARRALRQLEREGVIVAKGESWRLASVQASHVGRCAPVEWRLVRCDAATGEPAESLPSPDPVGVSQRQLMIRTVEAARRALGIPPTRFEWQSYVEDAAAYANDVDAAALVGKTEHRLLRGALLANKSRTRREGRRYVGLLRLPPPEGLAGAVIPRWSLDATTEERFAAHAIDLITQYQPARELAAIAAHRETWCTPWQPEATSRAAECLAALREATLARVLAQHIPPDHWGEALDRAERAICTHRAWVERRRRSRQALGRDRRRVLRWDAGDVDGLKQWVGEGGLARGLRDHAGRALPITVPHCHAGEKVLRLMAEHRYADAARIPPLPWVFRYSRVAIPPAKERDSRSEATPSLRRPAMHRDRVDAWRQTYHNARCPVAEGLIADAIGVLGRVLRDPLVLQNAMGGLGPGDHGLRAVLIVARGLLGLKPNREQLEAACARDEALACLLAGYLADPGQAVLFAREVTEVWSGQPSSRELATAALVRLVSGDALRLIEGD